MYLVEGIQNNKFYDGTTTWSFNRELMSPVYNPSELQHAVVVEDRLLYHLDNKVMTLFSYPITRLLWRHEHFNYSIRIEKLFILRSKYQTYWRKIRRHSKCLQLDIGCFCIGKKNWGKSKWRNTWNNLCPCMECREN